MVRRFWTVAAAMLAWMHTVAEAQEFTVESADGTAIHGIAEPPKDGSFGGTTVIMVAGTGLFDRDARFGRSGTDRDFIFRDLASRMQARGLATVRYDRRGVNHGAATPADALDAAISGTSTVETQRDDLGAVYGWVRSEEGLQARCVILLGHSEGMLHIGRLASSQAPAPLAVLGIGAPMRSPVAALRWQMTGRDAYSLESMDADGDGFTSNEEVEANWRKTPSSAFDRLGPLLNPNGGWSAEAIADVRAVQSQIYEQQRTAALALEEDAPYPNATTPMARASWWKSWFTDTTPVAERLAAWDVPFILHYGEIDSQAPPSLEVPAARAALGDRASLQVHPERGHTLGSHALYGPLDEELADLLADEAAAAMARCGAV